MKLHQEPVLGGHSVPAGSHVVRSPPCQYYIVLIACPSLDHLVELALLNSVLEANLCTPLLADQTKTTEEKRVVLLPIIRAANDVDNNMFLVTAAVENFVSWEIISTRWRSERSHTL
jgi:hypothetical protein